MTDTVSANRVSTIARPSVDFPRKFCPDDLNFSTVENLTTYFDDLSTRPLDSMDDADQWLIDFSEFRSVIFEERTRLYIAMTCEMENRKNEKNYLNWVEKFDPVLKEKFQKLYEKFVECPYNDQSGTNQFALLRKYWQNSIEIFRPENIPLETEVSRLSQQYQKILGSLTLEFNDREYTMQQMILFLQDTDRANRKKAFETSLKRWQDDAEELDEIFNKLLKIRIQIAKNAGYDDYIAYKFKSLGRFDYTPAQCLEFHEAIEKVVVPICRKAMEDRRKEMDIDQLFPWDVNTDPMGRDPLRPFEDIEQLVNGCLEIFNRVDSELGANFKHMIDLGLLDLSSRRGKAPGGFQITLSEVKLPFIFMNAVGTNRDLFTLLHEGGHAFHTFAARNQPIIDYRPAPMEFSEVASMAMENLSREHLDVFYNDADAARAQYEHLAKNIFLLPWIATVDAFQHWMYSNPDHTNAERDKYWIELMQKYNDGINYTGYEHALKYRWHAQIHIFERPFYYIEYGIALLGALQIWRNSKIDKKAAIQNYKNALSKGGSVSIPELFESAGIRFEFSADTIRPLMDLVGTEMKRLRELEIG